MIAAEDHCEDRCSDCPMTDNCCDYAVFMIVDSTLTTRLVRLEEGAVSADSADGQSAVHQMMSNAASN